MNIAWNYTVVGLLTGAAAAIVAIGEPASAELRIAEAAKTAATAGAQVLCALGPRAEPAPGAAGVD